MDQPAEFLPPHVLIFPLPVQGHMNSMLKLAEILALSGFHITFLNSDHTHHRLLHHTDILARFSRYPGFSFETIADGLPEDHPRCGHQVMEIFDSIERVTAPLFKEMLISRDRWGSNNGRRPVTCVIADGIFNFAVKAAKEAGIKCIAFRTISACCFWIYFCLPELIEAGDINFKGNDMDRLITSVPGMEGLLRRRDLPSLCQSSNSFDPILQYVLRETQRSKEAHGLILNTFEDLEGPVLSRIRSHFPNLYTIGPNHAQLKCRLNPTTTLSGNSSNSLWEIDRTCMKWLDSQPSKSVIYVSFGSVTTLSRDELMEFWHGLVNSKKRFLWVIRPDSVSDKDGDTPMELLEGTKERGYMVSWAPQEEVLDHYAIGGFLTHSGWNSTLESVYAGVPMICWPFFADQPVNSRFVNKVWNLGLDMKDTCDRSTVEKMVNDLMDLRREKFVKSANEMAELARQSVNQGGSSFCSLNRLIEDIRLMIKGAEFE